MNTRWKIALAVLLAILGAWLVVRLMQTPEPSYQGKTISEWLDDRATYKPTGHEQAIKAIGTNALPCIIRCLARNDSDFLKAFRALHDNNGPFMRKFLPRPATNLHPLDGSALFSLLGTNSIPHAIALLKHRSPTARQAAVNGLRALRIGTPTANEAIPALIEALEDKELFYNVAQAIAEFGEIASNAVPVLTRALADAGTTGVGQATNNFYNRRAVAAHALGKIGSSAASALPDLKAALQEPDFFLRGQAASAIWRISGDVDTALPVLLREMPGTGRPFKRDWITALGEMGPRAKAAVPLLQSELDKGKVKWFLEHITNALNRIDPEHLGKAGQESRPAP